MTIVEKSSNRKKVAILELVKNGEYSVAYALNRVEEVSTYLENLISNEQLYETEEITEENIVEEE